MKVACLTGSRTPCKRIASAMVLGIREYGDEATIVQADTKVVDADCAVMYGWKYRQHFQRFPQYVYADLGFWCREDHFRLSVNGWSPDGYVRAGLSPDRLAGFGINVQPWNRSGTEILIMGSTAKSSVEHGFSYMQWETMAARSLLKFGKRVVYRPKPKDMNKHRLPVSDAGYDMNRPMAEALRSAWFVVTHHSNAAVDALVAGVPVHCVTGAAAAFSVPLESAGDPPLLQGREQFLADVAWLNWSLAEMRSGLAWAHLRERRLVHSML